MPVIEAHKLEVADANQAIYNGFDDCLTYEIDQAREALRENDTLIYDLERAMQGPVLEMMGRGFRVDMHERENAIIILKEKQDSLERILSAFVNATGASYTNKLSNSPKQLQELFYYRMGLKPIERVLDGETKRPMNRETLEKLSLSDQFAEPIINAILLDRDLKKSLQVLETQIDPDWRWRCSYNIGGTTTGRFSSSKSPFMAFVEESQAWKQTGCVLPSTEALTPTGWKKIDEIQEGDLIAQWSKWGIEFSPCLAMTRKDFSGSMLQIKGEQIQQTLTPNHRVLYLDSRMKKGYVDTAANVAKLSQEVLPLGGKFVGGVLNVPRYAAMLMADFSKEYSTWRATFKKERKIERLLSIVSEFDLNCEEQPYHNPEYRRFVLRDLDSSLPRKWGSWILDLTPEAAEDLLDEARYWDATDRGSGFIFFTKDEDQATWFATLAHITGRSATKRLVQQNEGSYSTTPIWWVNVKNRKHVRVQKSFWNEIPYTGKVYCPTVASSFWLMRENGFISVTGNSNFQNITEELRRVFIPDPGFKLYGIDKAQSEARDVGWFCGIMFGDWSYLDACESGDLHTAVTRLLYPDWDWTGDLKKDRQIAERRFYRLFTFRDASKRLGHATNYYGSPREISRQTRIPLNLVEEFQERYFTAFPCIRRMHEWVAQQLQRERFLVNSFGRKRDFFDRPNDPDTLKGGIAYLFQSATGDCLNLGLYRLWKKMGTGPVQILSQLHDAVYFQMPETTEAEEQDWLRQALDCIQVTQKFVNRSMTIPGEAVAGYNWAHRYRLLEDGSREDWNPKGLQGIRIH